MMDRNNIHDLITEIEQEYPVNRWKHNGYYLWPVLRIRLFMYLVNQEITVSNKPRNKAHHFSKLWSMAKTFYDYLSLRDISSNIYLGTPEYCVTVNGKSYNRYFDTLMDKEKSAVLYFNKSSSKKGVYKPERHFLFSNMLLWYKIFNKLLAFTPKSPPQIHELISLLQKKGLDTGDFERTVISSVRNVDLSLQLSMRLLKKVRPKKIWVLWYYSNDVLGLLIAAHKYSIPTIDMQHGGHGNNHLAYNSWTNVPKDGYEALPDYFYTWDNVSARDINQWAEKTEKHMALQFGNPWLEGWKLREFKQTPYVWPENLILYTLQPIGEPLEDYILETIYHTKEKWTWWLRLHPRQMDEKEKIVNRLQEYNLLKFVNIEEATILPLPEILTHTKVHITKFSGSALEASYFKIPSLIIDLRGVEIYRTYIESSANMSADLKKDSTSLKSNIEAYFC